MAKRLTFTVSEKASGKTIRGYLKSCAGFSEAQIRRMKFRENGICLNGQRSRVTAVLKEGDRLELLVDEGGSTSSHLVSDLAVPEILYEDEDVAVVNKPAGIAVHPAHGHYNGTLANQLAAYFRKRNEAVSIRCIGRLDKETSGIVLFAKNRVAAARLAEQREQGRLRKQYLALCRWDGEEIGEGWHTITKPIAPLEGSLMKMCVHPEGKPAVTHYRVESCDSGRALLRLWLETGRTHQIRVHMASENHPLLGDVLYGDGKEEKQKSGIFRAALHAETIDFFQPFTGEAVSIRVGLPEDMKRCCGLTIYGSPEKSTFIDKKYRTCYDTDTL